MIGTTYPAVTDLVSRLEALGILREITGWAGTGGTCTTGTCSWSLMAAVKRCCFLRQTFRVPPALQPPSDLSCAGRDCW
jgi:hypothetical protein